MTEADVVSSHPTWIGTGVKAKIAFHAFVLRSISRVGVLVIEIKSVPTPCIFQVKLTPHLKLPIMRLVKKIVVRLSYGLCDCSVIFERMIGVTIVYFISNPLTRKSCFSNTRFGMIFIPFV